MSAAVILGIASLVTSLFGGISGRRQQERAAEEQKKQYEAQLAIQVETATKDRESSKKKFNMSLDFEKEKQQLAFDEFTKTSKRTEQQFNLGRKKAISAVEESKATNIATSDKQVKEYYGI